MIALDDDGRPVMARLPQAEASSRPSAQHFKCLIFYFSILKLIFSSSPFLPRSVSSFTHWWAGTFNCPLCGRIWRFKCTQVRQIKPAHLAFGRTI